VWFSFVSPRKLLVSIGAEKSQSFDVVGFFVFWILSQFLRFQTAIEEDRSDDYNQWPSKFRMLFKQE